MSYIIIFVVSHTALSMARVFCGKYSVENILWKIFCGKYSVENILWKIFCGKYSAENIPFQKKENVK
jgi:hypothetical protein